ncbi:hypothetical protein [Butyricicoccus porcorum]|uniref:hypothetical protein n=1 Tax=Butyricicoccus porcorum TaxID=1945634 RepID=UPI001FA8E5B5|nr:hypothetical protein [Butyricicoccus porcorum]
MTDEILFAARNYLNITWNDAGENEKLSGILSRGMQYLNQIAGTELDYEAEDSPKALLFEYARYVRAEALDEFQSNYLHELLSLQIREEAKRYDSEQSDTDV